MRVGLVRKIGFTLVALGVVGLGGCNDDPLNFDEQTAVRMFTNPSFMVVRTGDSVQMVANGINAGNEPTFQPVTATVASCGGSGSISVVESGQQTSIQPPQIYSVIGGAALGGACVIVQSGSVTDTVDVVVVGGTLNVVTAPTLIIAGTGGTVTVELVGTDGTPVTPFDPTDVAWSSDNPAILAVDASGNFTNPGLSGAATITATWTGTDATGTSGQGVSLTATASVTVKPDVPVGAAFDATASFGAIGAGATSVVAVLVTDQFGNQVTDATQVLGITVMSDNLPAATAADNFAPDALGSLAITVTGVGAGAANISGTVTTSTGVYAYGPAVVNVLNPQIASLTPDNGNATGQGIVTVAGAGFVAAGFTTTITVSGVAPTNFTVDSDNQITIEIMPASSGGPGPQDVVVDVGGVGSPAATWTQNTSHPEDTTEPANNTPGAVTVTFPLQFNGVLGASVGDINDFFEFTLAAPATIQFDLSWLAATGDLDLLVDDTGIGYSFPCGFPTATAAIPESGMCALAAGSYALWINDYAADGPIRTYTITAEILP